MIGKAKFHCLSSIREIWNTTIRLKKEKHFYKYIIDDKWEINPKARHKRGNDGIENKVVE